MEICGEENKFRGDIEIASVLLSTESREFAKLDGTTEVQKFTGNHYHRKEILDIFIKHSSKIISYPQLFAEARRDAENAAIGCSTEAALTKQIQRYSNHVFISGEAGLGKSLLSKVLVQEMLNPFIKLYNAEFVFYIKFCDLNYINEMDFLEFLTFQNPSFATAAEDRIEILKHLDRCSNVTIVMDGLDEADIKPLTNYPKCNFFAKATAATFIKNLF